MKIFVTGANGFIGKNFVNYASELGHKIYAVSRKKSPHIKNRNIKFLKGKFYEGFRKELKESNVLIHFASTGVIQKKSLDTNLDINLFKSEKFLNNAIRAGCMNWLIISSSSEYGHTLLNGMPVNKNSLTLPNTNYGISKNLFTNAAIDLAKKFKVKCRIARVFQVYGRGESEKRLYKGIIKAAKQNKEFKINNPNEIRDFSYIDEILPSLLEMCNFKKSRKFIEPEIWHIASGNTYTIYDFAKKVYLSHNKELKLVKLKYNGKLFHHISDKKSLWSKERSKL